MSLWIFGFMLDWKFYLQHNQSENRYGKFMHGLDKIKLLILDDIGLKSYSLEESRYNKNSTVLAGQISHTMWYELFPGPTIADAILDRIIHNSYIIELDSKKSMREMAIEKALISVEQKPDLS